MFDKALDLYEQMSVKPNNVIYTLTFRACAELASDRAIRIGETLLAQILQTSAPDNIVLSSAIHMLMKFGNTKQAEHLFQSIKDKDITTYASMMKVYNLNKQPLKTLQLLQTIKQQGLTPDVVIFTLCIDACSQVGILTVCQELAAQIPSHLQGNPMICDALIDMWVGVQCCTLIIACFLVFVAFCRVKLVRSRMLSRYLN